MHTTATLSTTPSDPAHTANHSATIGRQDPAGQAADGFEVVLATGETTLIDGADAYQPEGPLTTFFRAGSSRTTIDSWSTRLASFRTADIVAVRRAVAARAAGGHLSVVA